MTSKALRITTISLFVLFFPCLILATELLSIVINEIAWMGTNNSYNDEWTVTTNEHFLSLQVLV